MSIASEISRLQQAKADIKTAIENKGVTVPSDATLDDYANLVDSISGGGGGVDWESIARGMTDGTTAFSIPSSVEVNPLAYQFNNRTNLTGDVVIKSGATIIDTNAFCNTRITGVSIPSSVTSIGQSAFASCLSLPSLTIPDSVTSITHYAIRNCTSLVTLVLPNSLASLGLGVFTGNTSLLSVSIPPTLATIPRETFQNCRGLTSVTISEGVTTIDLSAFRECRALTTLTIPNSVTTIGEIAFLLCNHLTSVTIGSSITSIGSQAFQQCSLLEEFIINATTPPTLGTNVFNGCTALTAIYVPDASVSAYQSATNWTTYASKIKSINDRPTT